MSIKQALHGVVGALSTAVLATTTATTALAQTAPTAPDAKPGTLRVAVGIDVANAYLFRGIRQDDTRFIVWPYADVALKVYVGDGFLRGITIGGGSWNSLHRGDAGTRGPSGEAWYESRASGALGLQFRRNVSVSAIYTAYLSPNDMFTTVKEAAVRLGLEDRTWLGGAGLRPYALLAFEMDTTPGVGQLDGGFASGRYLELGLSPGYSRGRLGLRFPVKVGLSLGDYYELAGRDRTFGFASAGGVATVPVGKKTKIGQWNVRGGIEVAALGDATKVWNGGDRMKVSAWFGAGLQR